MLYVPSNTYDLVKHGQNVNNYTFPFYQHLSFNTTANANYAFAPNIPKVRRYFKTSTLTTEFGYFALQVLHPLQGPPSSSESISVSIYVSLKDVKLYGKKYNEQMDMETKVKSMSRDLTKRVFPNFDIKPVVTTIKDIISNPIGSALDFLGFQCPTDVKAPDVTIPLATTNFVNTRGLNSAQTLTLDVTTRPLCNDTLLNPNTTPEVSLLKLAQRPGVVGNFVVTSNSTGPVYEICTYPNALKVTAGAQTYSSPFRMVASQSILFSGTTRFQLVVTASPFAKMSLMFSWNRLQGLPNQVNHPEDIISTIIDFSGSGTYEFATPYMAHSSRLHTNTLTESFLTISVVNPPFTSDDSLVSQFACTLLASAGPDVRFFHRKPLVEQTDFSSLFSKTLFPLLGEGGVFVDEAPWEGESLEHLADLYLTRKRVNLVTNINNISVLHPLCRCFAKQRYGCNATIINNVNKFASYRFLYNASEIYGEIISDPSSNATISVVIPYIGANSAILPAPWVQPAALIGIKLPSDVATSVAYVGVSDDSLFAYFTYPGINSEIYFD